MAKIELTIAVNKTFEFDIEDIKEYYPSILTEMKKRGLNIEDPNELCEYIFSACINFITDYDNPLFESEEIDKYSFTFKK